MPLILPPHLTEVFDAAAALLAAGLPKQHLVLSGGSVLQSLWSHRTSTDLDFFLPEAAVDADREMQRNRMRIIAQAARRRGHKIAGLDSHGVSGWISDVHFSLGVVGWMPLDPGRDTVQDSPVQAADLEEVFIGKIHGRFSVGRRQDGRVPIRDLYDLTVCMQEAPHVLRRLFAGIQDEQAQRYAKRLNAMPPNWHELDEDEIIDPTYNVDLNGLPQTVAQAVEQRDTFLIPVAVRGPALNGGTGSGAIGGGP